MRRFALLLPFAAAAMIAAGCGEDRTTGSGSASGFDDAAMTKTENAVNGEEKIGAEASMTARGARVKVVDSAYGRVIADRHGEAFYLFDEEEDRRSKCYGACARVWPPVLSRGRPQAGAGANQNLLGTTKRRSGKLQVTYAGQPLYYYAGDSPGTILCHDVKEFGGLWLVVKPNGKAAG